MVAGLLAAGDAAGQTFNVDIDGTTGAGSGVPAITFGAVAATPGRWNSVPAAGAGPFRLLLLNGATSTVTLTREGAGSGFGVDNAMITGDFARLLEDLQNIANPNPANNPGSTIVIAGLAPGDYEIYTYAIAPDSSTLRSVVTVVGSPDAPATVGGVMPANRFTLGITHCLHRISVVNGENVRLNVRGGTASPGSLNGFQIKQVKPGRLYVQSGASAGGDGRAWGSAYASLTDALAQWETMRGFAGGVGVPEVWVSQGTYMPTTGSSREASFVLVTGARLFGGFRGTAFGNGGEVLVSQRTSPIVRSTLSGEIGAATDVDNSKTIVATHGPALLDRFSIEGGFNNGGGGGGGGGGEEAGGAGVRVSDGALTLVDCAFKRCTSKRLGGAVRLLGAASIDMMRGEVVDCSAEEGGGVVGASHGASALRVVNTRIVGGVSVAGASTIDVAGAGALVNVEITGARGNRGVLRVGGVLSATNITVAGCQTGEAGQAALSMGVGSTLENSIVASCRADDGTGAPSVANGGVGVLVRHSVVRGVVGGVGNTNMPAALKDPFGTDLIAGTVDDDLTPMACSPASNAGNVSVYLARAAGIGVDVRGLARISAAGATPASLGARGVGKPLDMGAIEAQSTTCCGDFNFSGAVNVQDVFAFLDAFFQRRPRADVDESGAVEVGDLFAFLAWWFSPCPMGG